MSDGLDGVREAMLVRAAAHRALLAAVQAARTTGASWTQIGQVFGISRQAAQKRFGAR